MFLVCNRLYLGVLLSSFFLPPLPSWITWLFEIFPSHTNRYMYLWAFCLSALINTRFSTLSAECDLEKVVEIQRLEPPILNDMHEVSLSQEMVQLTQDLLACFPDAMKDGENDERCDFFLCSSRVWCITMVFHTQCLSLPYWPSFLLYCMQSINRRYCCKRWCYQQPLSAASDSIARLCGNDVSR